MEYGWVNNQRERKSEAKPKHSCVMNRPPVLQIFAMSMLLPPHPPNATTCPVWTSWSSLLGMAGV